jgi:TP901 family phage tail tape measure protein
MASITSQLIVSLIDGVSGPAKTVSNSLKGITRTVRETSTAPLSVSDKLGAAITRNNRAIDNARGRMLDAIGTLYVLKTALTAPIQSAQELEKALAELGAKGNLSAGQLKAVGDAAKKTSGDVNQFTTDIVKAQDFLVGMGLDVERSTKAMPTIGKAATATGASLEDLSKAGFAAMSNLRIGVEDLASSFDILVAAGKAGGFELKDMAQYLPSITALASAKGMKGQQGLSQIAAALQIVRRGAGDSAEAATNFNNILQKINSNDAIKNFDELGVDIQKVLKDAVAKGADPLEAALRAINQALGGDLSRIGELFADAQVQKGLIPLLTGLDDYIKLRDEAAKAKGVVDADFVRMMETGEQKMKAFQIAVQNLQTSIGNALIPVLNSVSGALKPFVEALTAIITAHPRVAGALIAITAGFIGLKAAMAGLSYLGLMGKGGLLASLSFGVNTLGASFMRLKGGATEMIRLQTALAGFQGLKLTGLQTAGAGLRGMIMAVPGLSGLASGMTAVGAALATVSAPVWGGIAIAVAAVAAAAFTLWRYWDRVKAVASGVAQALGELLGPALEKIRPVLDWFAPLGNAIASGWDRAKTAISSVSSWLGSLFQQETLTEADKEKAKKAGYDFVMALWNGMKSVFNELTAWVGAQVDKITAPVRNLANKVTGMFGGGSGAVEGVTSDPMGTGAVDGQRARGGPISKGGSYLVGEKGPELITAGRSGYVNKAGAATAGPITVSPVFNMTFNGKTEPEDVVQQIRRVLRDEVRETFRGVFSDTGMRMA